MLAPRQPCPELTTPGRIGSLWLPHRMLMGSMHLGIEGDAQMLDRLIAFYAERVRGGAALIITGGVAVHASGWEPHRFLISDARHRDDLARLADAIHHLGGHIALQLFHAGRYARERDLGHPPWAPSAVASRLTREVPQAISRDQIATLVSAYHQAAIFAAQAGFDGVEVMASEGYLLNSFVSSLTNLRSDDYGGAQGGLGLIVEIAKAVRHGLGPTPPLIYRISGWDLMGSAPDGPFLSQLTKALADAGVDGFNVGVGWHESAVPTVSQVVPQGSFAEVAKNIRDRTDLPVIAANRIFSHPLANTVIASEMMDFVAPARPWLADPAWALHAYDGQPVNPCIACNQACLDRSLAHPPQPVSCTVNPRAVQESSYPRKRSATPLNIAVVGAGPAGLEAARSAAELGHRVTLFEASDDIGGQLRMAMCVPGKEEIAGTIAYYRATLHRLGVQTLLHTPADFSRLVVESDAIFVATGVNPKRPDLPGSTLPHVLLYPTAFAEPQRLQGDIVIIGGGGIGLDLALFLASPPKLGLSASANFWDELPTALPWDSPVRSITVITRGKAGKSVGRSTRWILRQVLQHLGVVLEENAEARAITMDGVEITQNGVTKFLPADGVVISTGQVSNLPAFVVDHPLPSFHVIGGAREARALDMVRAIAEGLRGAHNLSGMTDKIFS